MPVVTRTPSIADSALLGCVGAEPAAFRPAYDALAPVAYGTALGILRVPDHAAEVTQDVMVELWRTAARFDPARDSARTWVATIARRRAVDRVRAERARHHREQHDLDATVAGSASDSTAETSERQLAHAAVRRCLDSLTPTQREAIIGAYFGGYTDREVAQRLGVALATVQSCISDGLIRLCESMQQSAGRARSQDVTGVLRACSPAASGNVEVETAESEVDR